MNRRFLLALLLCAGVAAAITGEFPVWEKQPSGRYAYSWYTLPAIAAELAGPGLTVTPGGKLAAVAAPAPARAHNVILARDANGNYPLPADALPAGLASLDVYVNGLHYDGADYALDLSLMLIKPLASNWSADAKVTVAYERR